MLYTEMLDTKPNRHQHKVLRISYLLGVPGVPGSWVAVEKAGGLMILKGQQNKEECKLRFATLQGSAGSSCASWPATLLCEPGMPGTNGSG